MYIKKIIMDTIKLLEDNIESIVDEAFESIEPVKLQGYTKVGETRTKNKLRKLLNETIRCIKEKSLIPMVEYTTEMAKERYNAGYDLYEVQTAINALEEAIWKKIFKEMKPEQYSEALGLTSTVLGAGKDNLATTYVELASKTKSKTINLQELFNGNAN